MICVGLCLALAAAPTRHDITPSPAVGADTIVDTVFVATNRTRANDHFTRDVSDSLWYGIYVARLVITSPSVARVTAAMHVTAVDSAALDASEWRARLRTAIRDTSASHAPLVFVHGYSTAPREAVSQGVQVKARGGHRGPLVLFLWPTRGLYVIPTPGTVYRGDARAAALSGPSLARLLRAVDSVSAGVVLAAHSMGSRVACDALIGDSAAFAQFAARPLRALGLFSPDVGAKRFRDEFAPRLPTIARRVALYGAATDYLLGAAVLINGERRAAGITRRGDPLPGIELIDDTRGARAEPLLLALAGPRHAVRWASAALTDFFGVVVAGVEPRCRVVVGTADSVSLGRWRLRRGVITPVPADSACLAR